MTPPALLTPHVPEHPRMTPRPAVDLRVAATDVVREMIRRDPALWERVQHDPELRRQFGFDDAPHEIR